MSGTSGACCENQQFGWTEYSYSKKLRSSRDFFSQSCFNDSCPQPVLAMTMRSPWELDCGAPGPTGPVHTLVHRHTVNVPEQI